MENTPDNSDEQIDVPPPDSRIFAGYISERELARQRGVSLRTCQRDRQLRQSPPYISVGKRVLYRIEAVRAWLLDQERQIDRKASAPRAGGRR